MERSIFLWTVLSALTIILANPLPQSNNNDLELLIPQDTLHYPYAFWLGRPVYDEDNEGGDNNYYKLQFNRRSSTISYANVGAGWGR